MPAGDGSSRSRSRERGQGSRSGSYDSYDSYSDNYSDEFYSDEESGRGREDKKSANTRKPPAGKSSVTGKGRVPQRGSKNSQGKGKPSQKEQDYVTKRVLSARRIKINELKNELEDVNQQLLDLRAENKRILRQQVIQEKALNKYEDTEHDMPHILAKNNEQVRALTSQVRQQKEKTARADRLYKDSAEELTKTQRLLKKMRALVEDKQLDDRDRLAKKLTEVESDLEDKDRRVKDLEKYVENLKKNHQHELGIERARYKEANKRSKDLEHELENLKHNLREKMKELDAKNIYANRTLRAGRNSTMNSTASSPAPLRAAAPRSRKNSESGTGATPRERAKQFEQQRKEQDRNNHEPSRANHSPSKGQVGSRSSVHGSQYYPDTIDENSVSSHSVAARRNHKRSQSDRGVATSAYNVVSSHRQPETGIQLSVSQPKHEQWQSVLGGQVQNTSSSYPSNRGSLSDSKHNKTSGAPAGGSHGYRDRESRQSEVPSSRTRAASPPQAPTPHDVSQPPATIHESYQPGPRESRRGDQSKTLDAKAEPDWFENIKNRKARPRQEEEEIEIDLQQERENIKQEAEAKVEVERRREENRKEEERRQREEERHQREEEQRKEEEERREQERRWREEEENRKRELEEIARRAQEERERLRNDAEEQERQRQKELLLARMKAIDNASEPSSRYEPPISVFEDTNNRGSLSYKNSFQHQSPTREPNVYTFSKPIDNMHHGKPAYEPGEGTQTQHRTRGFFSDDHDSSSGYQPSFNTNSAGKRKSKPVSDSRSDRKTSTKNDLMDQLFGKSAASKKTTSSTYEDTNKDLFSDENKSMKTTAGRRRSNQHEDLTFGQESTPPSTSNNKLLPSRRHQPQTTFNPRPVINAIDFDDDIEEVML